MPCGLSALGSSANRRRLRFAREDQTLLERVGGAGLFGKLDRAPLLPPSWRVRLMALGCTKDNCTVAETGICIAENPPETCPFRMKGRADDRPVSPDPPVPRPERNPSLPHSRALSPQLAQDLMRDRYCTLVG